MTGVLVFWCGGQCRRGAIDEKDHVGEAADPASGQDRSEAHG